LTASEEIQDIIRGSGLFDATFYLLRYPDVAAQGRDPLQHFVMHGAREGRDPSAWFSTRIYKELAQDLPSDQNPLVHFILSGKTSLPSTPSPRPRHVVSNEVLEKLRASDAFDAEWYLRFNPDVRDAGIDPLMHFLNFGCAEERKPAAKFPLQEYQARYKAELADGTNPLVDYVLNSDHRDLRFSFDEQIKALRLRCTDTALDITVAVEDRFRAACRLVSNVQDQYDDLIALFGRLAQEPSLAQSAERMQVLCRQLARRAKRLPMEPYHDPAAASLPRPVEDPILAHESVMVLRRPNATRVILVFTGADHRVWVPVQVFQSYLPEDAHVVFLRDPINAGHLFGLSALGFGYGNTLGGLQRLIQSLGADAIYCIGSSLGGQAAMRYGIDLGARRCLIFVPTTFPDPDAPSLAQKEAYLQIDLQFAQPSGSNDLREVYLASPSYPPTTIVFGGANADDSQHARHMQDLPNVTLVEVADYAGHDVMSELIASDQLEVLIQDMLAPIVASQ
jgi:pimeloyl-ACP methyl ester carboxylesterase